MIRKLSLSLLCALLLALAGIANAQTATTGQITGSVTDPTGAFVSGAKIVVVSEAGVKREITTDASGHYRVPQLPPGKYRMEISSTGFTSAKVNGIVVNITETTAQNVTLKVGAQTEVVEVTGSAPMVQTDSAATGKVIEQDTIRQLPLPTRNFQQLLTLSAGTAGSLQNSSDLGRGDATISVNGNRTTSNAVVVNGIDASSIGTGATPNLAVPATDTLQEFIVQTSLYDATQGRNSGGVVAAVTKSGTNSYHGNMYEFLRNTALNANNYFLNAANIKRQTYERNQFGATLGGPIAKDRTWFFLSYQGTRETNATSLSNSLSQIFVPKYVTSDRSATGLSTLMTAATGYPGIYLNPIAATILQAKLPDGSYLIPSTQGQASGSVTTPTQSTYQEDQINGNLDWKLSNANHLSLKAFLANNPTKQGLYSFAGVGNALQAPGAPTKFNMHQRIYAVSDTHLFNPRLINEVKFGYSEITGKFTPTEAFKASDFGISTPLQSLFPGAPTISITNMMDLGPSQLADNFSQTRTYTMNDMLTWTHGSHTVKAGVEYKRQEINLYFNAYTRGQMYFSSFPLFLLGIPTLTLQGSGVNDRNIRANDFSGFVQEDWRVNNRLTMNFGIRYDLYNPFYELKGRLVAFDPALAKLTAVGTQNVLTAGFVQAGNGNLAGVPKVQDGLVPTDYNNFAPRFGFSFRPLAKNSTLVVRGGVGVYYDRMNARLYNSQVFNAPYNIMAMNIYGSATLYPAFADPFVHVPLPSAFPASFAGSGFPLGGAPWVLPVSDMYNGVKTALNAVVPVSGIYPDRHKFLTPYVEQYNIDLQWEAMKNTVIDLGYVGSTGRKLTQLHSPNQQTLNSNPYSGPYSTAMSAMPSAIFGTYVESTSGKSGYNSLQASLTQKSVHGLSYLISYTYSHSIDDYSGGDVNDLSGMPGDTRKNYFASSDFDRRHRLVVSGTYDLPKFYHGEGAAKYLVNGWEFGGIATVQSGTPFSIIGSNSVFAYTFGNVAAGRTVASAKGHGKIEDRLNSYFDTTAFVAPTAYTTDFGSLRNVLVGPPQKNLDLSLVKFFPITEHQKAEFRTEVFNLFNHPNFANPVNVISAGSSYGTIVRTATGPRVIQFAFKYSF